MEDDDQDFVAELTGRVAIALRDVPNGPRFRG